MEVLVDVVKGSFAGLESSDGTRAIAVYIPIEARKFLNLRPPLKPRFKVFLDGEKKRIIYELQDFVSEKYTKEEPDSRVHEEEDVDEQP
ncbi:MAG: hypothetical protein QMD22_10005 [archaeon]|nr:hypothetical protein [archaeon]